MHNPVRRLRQRYLESKFNSDRNFLLYHLNGYRDNSISPYPMSNNFPLEYSYREAEKTAKSLARLSRKLGYNDEIVDMFKEMARGQRKSRMIIKEMRS